METANSRKKAYKATVDVEESRRKREELAIKIRKEKSAAQLRKRRTVRWLCTATYHFLPSLSNNHLYPV